MLISASGNSPNIIEGIESARDTGLTTVGLFGACGAAEKLVDHALVADHIDPGTVETTHVAILHALTRSVRSSINRRETALSDDGHRPTHRAGPAWEESLMAEDE